MQIKLSPAFIETSAACCNDSFTELPYEEAQPKLDSRSKQSMQETQ
jgi:hypothetical protein